ncbi:MarR family transcriptional regulator [Bailinhaonella thermotolerans]|uniref:MarR family transcriptional regulator n=2 Tax=Bailinhaonella thermotolerans TaxID=1070861 RepID=A0A3A4AJK7_9ACTN|nr:MarR family transcriptional regulator [Bailinhaonella thermotolerans]
MEADLAAVYTDLGLDGFRLRYVPVVLHLADAGPRAIRDLAAAIGVTHSAVSQTVAQMARDGLAVLTPGEDARQRIVRLTPEAERVVPVLRAEWEATSRAAADLDAELPYPLSRLVDEALAALRDRPLRDRVADAAPGLIPPAGGRPAPPAVRPSAARAVPNPHPRETSE